MAKKPRSFTKPILKAEGRRFAELILNLEAALLSCCKVGNAAQLPDEAFLRLRDDPAYEQFDLGAAALGFECPDMRELADIQKDPKALLKALGMAPMLEVRRYVHTLMRAHRWNDIECTPLVDGFRSGVLQLIAKRLVSEESLYSSNG